MSIKRIKELQKLADDFYTKLQLSEESSPSLPPVEDEKCIFPYNKKIKKSNSTIVPKNRIRSFNYKKSFSNYNIINSQKKLKPIIKRNENPLNAYNTIIPWVPPNYEGDYFESFKRLQDHYDLNNWEKVKYKYL